MRVALVQYSVRTSYKYDVFSDVTPPLGTPSRTLDPC